MIFLLALLWLAAIGLPLFALFGAASLGLFLDAPGGSWEALATDVFGAKLGDSPSLMTFPLLTFTGCLLAETGAPRRLRALGSSLLGWMPFALACASWLACALLTTLGTGTAVAAAAVLVLPGMVRLRGEPSERGGARRPFVAGEASRALAGAKWELALLGVLIGSQTLGSLRWHEAAALAGLFALLVATLIQRDVQLVRALPRVAAETVVIVGVVLAVVATAIGLNAWRIDAPAKLLAWLDATHSSALAFVLLINALLIAASLASSVYSALLLIVPLAMPYADHYQVDPYRLAIVFLLNAELARFIVTEARGRRQAPPPEAPARGQAQAPPLA